MSAPQFSAALGLLQKTLPDLQAIQRTLEGDVRHHVVSDQPLSQDDRDDRYCVGAPAGPTEGAD